MNESKPNQSKSGEAMEAIESTWDKIAVKNPHDKRYFFLSAKLPGEKMSWVEQCFLEPKQDWKVL